MGKTIDELIIGLTVDYKKMKSGLEGAVHAVQKDTTKLNKSLRSVSTSMNKMNEHINKIGKSLPVRLGLAGLAAGFAGLAVKMTKMSASQEDIFTRLKFQVESTGAKYSDAKGQIDEFLKSMQATTRYGDTDMAPVLGQITQLTGSLDKGFVGAKLAADMAASKLFDMNTAARYVAMAMQGNVEMLGRYIPELRTSAGLVNKNMSASQKWQIAQKLLMEKFGGAAQSDLMTFNGVLKQMRNYIGDVFERFGDIVTQNFAGTIRGWTSSVQNFIQSGQLEKWALGVTQKVKSLYHIVSGLLKFLASNWGVIRDVAVAFMGVVAAVKAWVIAQRLLNLAMNANPLGLIITAVGTAAIVIDAIVRKTVGWAAVWDAVRKSALIFWNFFKAFINSVKAYVLGIGNIFKSFGTIAVGVFTGSFKKIKQGWNDLKNAPKQFLSTVKENFTKAGANAVDIWNKTKKKIEDSPAVGELKIKKSGGSEAAGAFGLDPAKTEEAANRILEVHQNLSDETLAIRGTTKQAEIDMIDEVGQAQQQNTDDMQNALMEFEGNVQQSLTPFADSFYNMSKGIGTNWKKTWEKAGDFWLKSFLRKMMQGVSKLVTAVLVGENTKQTAFLKTAAIAISTGARETWAALRSAGASIYAALAKIAQSLASLGPFAIPAIAAAGVALWAIFSKFKSVIGLAKGGRIDQPTAALIGESGPEIVAPESDFLDYTKQILSQIAQAITQMIQTIQTPIINAIVPMAQVQMAGAASLAVSVPASGSISDVKIDEAIAILEQIRDKETTLEVTNEISGNDLYQIVKAEEKEQSRLER